MSSVSFFVFGVTLVHVDLCLHTFTHMTVNRRTVVSCWCLAPSCTLTLPYNPVLKIVWR